MLSRLGLLAVIGGSLLYTATSMDPSSLQPNATSPDQLQLLDLPTELLSQIASHHSPEDLISFSNASTLLRDVSCPLRYEQITLGWAIGVDEEGEIDVEGLLKLKKTVREMLEDLATNGRKLECVRTLRILEYGWFGQREWELLKQVAERVTVLETLQMALNGETATDDYLEHIEIFWQALMKVPTLHSFIGQQGPAVPLRFDSFAGPLKRIDVAGYSLDDGDGQLPKGLEKLTLTYVENAGPSWFPPETFDSLEMLLLRNTEEQELQNIIGIIKHLTTLFSSFDPAAFPKLDMIEILSTPGTDSFALQARAMAEELPECLRYSAESLESFADALNLGEKLEYLTTNILNEEEPNEQQAGIWFEEIKSLKQVSIRGSGPLLEGGAGYRAVRDEEGKVQRVEADGVRVLVGEDVPEGCAQ
ncbi:hypothetical protein BCR35DRAFT_311357 [Leucosporidium creatinivorum]|uniref:F-box domain-containing protein n=1 Tax=Leucosporidium creatinivorum TaxID=106004 RepID=A0A1Y2C2C6_9BASI|nr:hypothetical protein BCR35DRAFT_311357 [Leucosporidium creatinivorum]